MNCTIEIETLAGPGGNDIRECDQPAIWTISSAVGGKYGPPAYRCQEHIEGTIGFLVDEPTTTRVYVERI